MTEHPSGCRDTLHVHRGFRAPGSLIHELSRVSASCVCCAGRCWTVLKSRGRDARLVAPGAPRSDGRRWRGFQPSTGAAALNATPPPMTRPRPSRSAPNPRCRCKPSSTTMLTRPRAPWPGPPDGPALVPVRRIEGARCPKRRRSARAPCSATPKAHRKHSENTPKTPVHRMVSWRHPRHRGFNLLRFGQIRPNKHGPHESSSREFLLSHNRRPTLHHRPVDRELRPRGRIEVH